MKMGKGLFKIMAALLCLCLLLTACAPAEQEEVEVSGDSQQVQNLEKLCLVWGYTKYHHSAFLLGQKDWDEELLNLIPTVSEAKEEKVNDILHEWFVSLGEIDYGTLNRVPQWAAAKEEDKIVQADTSWINADYLGDELTEDLSQIETVPNIDFSKAPVSFSEIDVPEFSNEKTYENLDYSDKNYRLLGLFRVWNALEYYFPYFDIMEENWHELLLQYIPEMMEGSDLESFELTILKLTAHLHDAHVRLTNWEAVNRLMGKYAVPADLIRADGQFVIKQVYGTDCPLQPGDVVLKQDDQPIEEVAAYFTQYFSVPNEEKLANQVFPFLLRSENQTISITVQRDGEEKNFDIQGVSNVPYSIARQPSTSHEILEGNIGLINPSALKEGEISTIMQEFKETEGLIVDLRQYPSAELAYSLSAYLKEIPSPFAILTLPSQIAAGTMLKKEVQSGMVVPEQESYYYQKPVVVLINEESQSNSEFTTMSLRTGDNVTVLGSNSIGADGNIAYLPLLNDHKITFTSLGVYTPEMGQTQRIGLAPDIEVHPTIEGIKEGRDELMEAAVAYLQEQNLSSDAAPVQDNSEAPLGSPENPIAEEPQDNGEAPLGSPENPIAEEPQDNGEAPLGSPENPIAEEPQDNGEAPLGSPENPIAEEPQDNSEAPLGSPENPIAEEPQAE